MTADIITRHFVSTLGIDVGVSFDDPERPRQVVLYRPDRLSEDFVALAFQALEDERPDVADTIERVLVAYEGRLGRTRRSVDIRPAGAAMVAEAETGPLARHA